MEWDIEDQLKKAGAFGLVFLIAWLIGNAFLSSLIPPLNVMALIVAALIVFVLPMYASAGAALNADNKHKAPGGNMRGISMFEWGAVLVVVVIAVLLINAYAAPKGTQSVTGSVPTPGVSGGAAPIQVFTGPTYTLVNKSYDADKPGTAVSASAVLLYSSPTEGLQVSLAGVPIAPGVSLTAYTTASNYFANIQNLVTPTANVNFYQKAVDTAVTTVAYLNDLSTKITGTQNLTIGAGGSSVAHITFKQSANYKHPAGDSKIMCVFVNATSGQEGLYDPSNMNAAFDNNNCMAYGDAGSLLGNTARPASSAMGGSIVAAFVCNGVDFQAKDSATHTLDVKYSALGTTNPGAQNTTGVSFVGADYYTDQTGKLSLKPGCVSDTGSAIQAIQSIAVPVD